MTQDILPGLSSPTAGYQAVAAWSRVIHSRAGNRHHWALTCAEAMDAGGPDVHLPPYPSRHRDTRATRDETVRRIYRQAR